MYFCSMKFVYPFKYRQSTFEIDQSLRWLYLAYPDAEVYIIGDAPDIHLPYVHIPYTSHLPFAGCEVTDKVMLFCQMIGDEFILMNDDFFITDKFPFHQVMKNGYVTISPGHSITYQQACENTIDFLAANHLELVNYECHQPVLIQSCRFIELFSQVEYQSYNHLLKSMYFNTWPMPSYQGDNLKLGHSLNKAKRYLDQYGAFSCADSFLTTEHMDFISKYSNFAESAPSVACQLCHSPKLPPD